jgi:hypothetical protein
MTLPTIAIEDILAKAILLNRKARVPQQALKQLRQALKGNQLALDNLGGFLRYANRLLTDAEQRKEKPYDIALAIVEYAGCEFWFIRDTGRLANQLIKNTGAINYV